MGVHIKIGIPLKGFTVLAGFPGIGLVGPIVARHVVESLDLKLVGSVASPEFPAVSTIKNGVALPPVRIYADEGKKIAVIVSEVAFSEKNAREIGEALVQLAKKQGVERIVSIAGVIMPAAPKDAIWGAASHPDDVKYLMRFGVSPVQKGITTGISATLLMEGQRNDVPVVLILGALHSKEDFRAAADIVKTLDNMLGLNISYEDLLERAERIEQDVAHIAAQSKREDIPMYG